MGISTTVGPIWWASSTGCRWWCLSSSGTQLAELLRGNHRYVFTLIQKFRIPELLCDRSDVVVITDEAHRSQYDTLALNMRTALAKALFTAFTGTPLIDGEERTREVFGDYVSIYENRTPELQLVNPNLNDDIYAVIEAPDLDGEEELAMFDIPLQSAPDLSDSDRAKVKQSARELVKRCSRTLKRPTPSGI